MRFIRVQDDVTGHQFDVPESDKRIGDGFTVLDKPQYPPVSKPRRPKHYVGPARVVAVEEETFLEEEK